MSPKHCKPELRLVNNSCIRVLACSKGSRLTQLGQVITVTHRLIPELIALRLVSCKRNTFKHKLAGLGSPLYL
jgi:hypothetical protein